MKKIICMAIIAIAFFIPAKAGTTITGIVTELDPETDLVTVEFDGQLWQFYGDGFGTGDRVVIEMSGDVIVSAELE